MNRRKVREPLNRCPECGDELEMANINRHALTYGLCRNTECVGGLVLHVAKGETPGDFTTNLLQANDVIDTLFFATIRAVAADEAGTNGGN